MRRFLFSALAVVSLSLGLSAQEQFLGITYDQLRAAWLTESDSITKIRLKRFMDFEAELSSMRSRGLRTFVASGVSDSLRDIMNARITAVNQLDSLAQTYRKARIEQDDALSSNAYFEYLKSLRTLKMRDQFVDMFADLPPMGPELFMLPGEAMEEEPEPVTVVKQEPIAVEPPVDIVKPIKPQSYWADSWNFWLGASLNYNVLLTSDSVAGLFGPDESYSSYGEPGIGYSFQLGFARKLGGAFSVFLEAGANYSSFAYKVDYTDFSSGAFYNSTEEYELLNLQAAAGLKIRLGVLDLKFAYLHQEAFESFTSFSDLDDTGILNTGVSTNLDELDVYQASRGAAMFEMAFSMIRKGYSHRKGDMQFFIRATYDLADIYDLSNSTLNEFTLAQAHLGLRFQY